MTHQFQNIEGYHAGDAVDIVCTVQDENGDIIDITNATEIEWYLKNDETDADVDAILTKKLTNTGEIEITNGTGGEFTIYIDTDDTTGESGTYHHRARLTDADGDRSTIFTGTFDIEV